MVNVGLPLALACLVGLALCCVNNCWLDVRSDFVFGMLVGHSCGCEFGLHVDLTCLGLRLGEFNMFVQMYPMLTTRHNTCYTPCTMYQHHMSHPMHTACGHHMTHHMSHPCTPPTCHIPCTSHDTPHVTSHTPHVPSHRHHFVHMHFYVYIISAMSIRVMSS